jgi:hypothetical protein
LALVAGAVVTALLVIALKGANKAAA